MSRIWSNRKRREILEILSHFDPSNEKRCYLGGFLRYGVKLSVDEILDICDTYAKWNDYDREKTAYHLKHIEHRSKKTPVMMSEANHYVLLAQKTFQRMQQG